MVVYYSDTYRRTLEERYTVLECKPDYFDLYFMFHKGVDNPINAQCDLPKQEITQNFLKVIKLLDEDFDPHHIDKTEILMLGHRQYQFDDYLDKKYLKKINLNDLDAGKFSSNKWAESRAYVTKDSLFSESTEFVGTITSEWKNKYNKLKIDEFENSNAAKILYNSKPEDNIVLCAESYCPCEWIKTKKQGILNVFCRGNKIQNQAVSLLKELDITLDRHIKVPSCHQFIAHKKFFEEYSNYLKNNCILDRVSEFVKTIREDIKQEGFRDLYYHSIRSHAYIMEMVSMYYFAKQNYLYVPCVFQNKDWYHESNIRKRVNQWNTTT